MPKVALKGPLLWDERYGLCDSAIYLFRGLVHIVAWSYILNPFFKPDKPKQRREVHTVGSQTRLSDTAGRAVLAGLLRGTRAQRAAADADPERGERGSETAAGSPRGVRSWRAAVRPQRNRRRGGGGSRPPIAGAEMWPLVATLLLGSWRLGEWLRPPVRGCVLGRPRRRVGCTPFPAGGAPRGWPGAGCGNLCARSADGRPCG